MRECKKCGNSIPKLLRIDGKRKNLQNRKFCLECSPFGEHNTRDLSKRNKTNVYKRVCGECGREFNSKYQKGQGKGKCHTCYFNEKLARRKKKVYSIVGTACWVCLYDKGMEAVSVLDFHHVVRETKCFNVSSREMANLRWDSVLAEIKKCALLCCRCHREVENGLIDERTIANIYAERWRGIGTVAQFG